MKLPSGIELEVCSDIARRQQLGIAKYGKTVAENPLSLRDWLQHAYEECLDQCVYLKRAIAEIDSKRTMMVIQAKEGFKFEPTKASDWNPAISADEGFKQAAKAGADSVRKQMLENNPPLWNPVDSSRLLTVHDPEKCAGKPCCVHNPSDHHMKDWPQNYLDDTGVTERICPHGIGHPDPDQPWPKDDYRWIHGCDGCCRPPKKHEQVDPEIA